MCDAMSMLSAGQSAFSGYLQSEDLKSQGDLQNALMKASGVIAQAEAKSELELITRDFTEAAQRNVAQMAISGLDPSSFSAVTQGNQKELRNIAAKIDRGADRKQADLNAQGEMERTFKRIEAKAALMNGFTQAGETLLEAETSYQDSKLPNESRWDFAKRASRKRRNSEDDGIIFNAAERTMERARSAGGSFFARS